MLRVAFLPKIYDTLSKDVTSLSGFVMLFWMLKKLVDDKLIHLTVYLPSGVTYDGVESDGVNVEIIDASRKNWTFGASMVFEELLRKRKLDADLVLTNQLVMTGYYDLMQFEPKWGMNNPVNVPFLTYVDETEALDSMQFWRCDNAHVLCGTAGIGDHNGMMFLSEFEKKVWLSQARRFFAPHIVSRMAGMPVVNPPILQDGFDFEDQIRKRMKRREKDKTLVMFNAQAPQPGPWFTVPYRAMSAPLLRRRGVKWRLLSQNERILDVVPRQDWIEYKYPCKRVDVLSNLNSGDVVVYLAGCRHIGSALGVWEGILGGQLPIFDKKTDALAGRIPDSYPFRVSNEIELSALLLYLTENYDGEKVQGELRRLREFVRSRVDVEIQSRAMLSAMMNLVNRSFVREAHLGGLALVVRQCAEEGLSGSSEEMSGLISSRTEKGICPLPLLGCLSFRRLLQCNGYEDVGGVKSSWRPVGPK